MNRGPLTAPRLPVQLKAGLLYSSRLVHEVHAAPVDELWTGRYPSDRSDCIEPCATCDCAPPQAAATAAAPVALRLLAIATVLVLLALLGCLAGCGGGGPEEDDDHDKTVQPVRCAERPELCQ